MAEDPTYRTLVYHERGGSAEVVNSGGIIRGHSGGIMSMESGFRFILASQNILVKDIARVVHSRNEPVIYEPGDNSVFLQDSNLPYNVRFVKILGSDAAQSMSFWLTSCSAGAEVFLHLCGDSVGTFTNASTQVDVSCSGCICLDSVGAAVSGFEMHTSLASDCGVHLVAIADNVWSIVSQFGDINT